ncbi:MAG: Na+/H+ antiporter subunit B [Candidatus Thermoplasmatota archaeon]|nr:Na+/H+ antiporter subunit B [Candidatus Thermoplasmatota archaeon]
MRSLILRTSTRLIMPLMLLFSVFLLLRGHHEPGGGFVGGLVAGGAYGLYQLAEGPQHARRALSVDPRTLMGLGLALAGLTALYPLALGRPLLTGLWYEVPVPLLGTLDLGTPLIFDVGVYLAVLGMATTILFHLEEEAPREASP